MIFDPFGCQTCEMDVHTLKETRLRVFFCAGTADCEKNLCRVDGGDAGINID